MTILNVISAMSLTNYLGKTKTPFNMSDLVEEYKLALEHTEFEDYTKDAMLVRFTKIVVGYVPQYQPKRRRTKIPHPLANERSGLFD